MNIYLNQKMAKRLSRSTLATCAAFVTLAALETQGLTRSLTQFALTAAAQETKSTPKSDSKSMEEKIEDATDSVLVEGQKAFFDAIDKKSIAFQFNTGASNLTNTEKRSLRALVGAQDTRKEKAYIAAWGDQVSSKDDASSAHRQTAATLATNRINAAKEGLTDAGFKGDIVILNMVSKPSALAEGLGFEAEEIKSAARETAPDASFRNQKIAEVLQAKGGLNKTVIVLVEDR